MSAFDKAEYHAKAEDFPKVDYYQAYIHIGFFLGFLADEGLLSKELLLKKKVKQFINREIKPGELAKFLGGKIDPFDLSDVGKRFSYFIYPGNDESGDIVGISTVVYLDDYADVLSSEINKAGSVYLISDDWQNFDRVKSRIGERFKAWVATGSPTPKYREFKSFSDSDVEKVKVYLRNTLSTGVLTKIYPDVSIEETTFRSYMIKIDGRGNRDVSKMLYASEAKIRDYLKAFTDRKILFNLK